MRKLANLNYDITDFVTASKIDYVIKITKDKDELIKNAHVPSLDEIEKMPDDQFALILFHPHLGKLKKLAMTDKYITELNMEIFSDKLDEYPEEIVKVASSNFMKAAKFYKLTVPENIKKYASTDVKTNWVNIAEIKAPRFTSIEKTASTAAFALGKKYPINTPELVKKAVAYFAENSKRFSPTNAFEFAVNVKLAADKMKVNYVGSPIEKYANINAGELSKNFKAAMLARKGYASEEDRGAYDDLIKQASALGPVKVAKVLEELDRATGVNRVWNTAVLDPIFTTFGSKDNRLVKVASMEISSEDLKKLPDGLVDDATLHDLKGDEGLDVFQSLPTPVRTKLARHLKK